MTKPKMQLKGIAALLVDNDHNSAALTQQMLRGLGLDILTTVETVEEARSQLKSKTFDLCIFEAKMPDGTATDLIRELRHMKPPKQFTPVIVATPYSHMRNVTAARDAGAHSVIRKPFSPQILYDHISGAASAARPFVDAAVYVGPDRRFKFVGAPGGEGRRESDLAGEIGAATEPNMSQDEIDALVRPTKVVI